MRRAVALVLLATACDSPSAESWEWEPGVEVCERMVTECARHACDELDPDCLDFGSCAGEIEEESGLVELHDGLARRIAVLVHTSSAEWESCEYNLAGVFAFRYAE